MKDLQLTLFLTNACNLNCVYCYEGAKNKHVMDASIAKSWIEKCLTQTEYDFVKIYLFGGEPLLRYDTIKEICEWTWSINWNVKYIFTIQTNGTLLNDSMKSWFRVNRTRITMCLSLDGTKYTHDLNRSNSFDKIDLSFFRETWPEQPVKMTISKNQIKNLKDDILFIQNKGFSIRGCNFAVGEDPLLDTDLDIISQNLHDLADVYIANPNMAVAPIIDLPLFQCEESYTERAFCRVGTDQLIVINTDGTRSPCSYFSSASFGRNWSKNEETFDIKKIQCYQKCYFFPVCGMCYGENYSSTGSLYKPSENQCRITKIRVAAAAYLLANKIISKSESEITSIDQQSIRVINKIVSLLNLNQNE